MNDDEKINLDPTNSEIVGLLKTVVNSLEQLDKRQAEWEAKVDARLHETRPIWEQVLSRLTAIEQGQERMAQRLDGIEQRLESMDRRVRWVYDEFKELKMRLRPVSNDVARLLNDRDDFEERILKLETERR